MVNRGTTSVEVDLKDPAGIETGAAPDRRADIFVEGYRPGVVERLGLGPDVVLDRNPAIVFARITGLRPDGPAGDSPSDTTSTTSPSRESCTPSGIPANVPARP